tara:strand:+ start:80103 stop:80495 length:393 start_codon:yes stop_codon:yes gene_type:complete
MKKLLSLIVFIACFSLGFSQQNLIELEPHKNFDNILIEKLAGDSLSTQFVIWVKDTVRTHKHEHHSEALYVLEGGGDFYLGKEMIKISKGDFISIPKNTWHAVKVTSEIPLKVISVQSPEFKGEDRLFKE